MKFLFSKPTAPAGKFTTADIVDSLVRLGVALLLTLGVWTSTDLSSVLGMQAETGTYIAAVAYSLGNLIQVIARQVETDQKSDPS